MFSRHSPPPGRYIYVARRLLERCPDDDSAAFVVAHEIAHHQLGHLRIFSHRLAALARVSHGWMAAASLHAIERAMYGPEKESAADHRALDLCLQAGYDGRKCLRVFDILAQHALDVGDVDGFLGLDTGSDHDSSGDAPWPTRLRTWTWERMLGYPSTQVRRDALERYLNYRSATPIPERPRSGFS